jgi:hypothetical protein
LQTPASFLNVIGTILALSGVFAYSMAERLAKSKSKVKGPPPYSPFNPSLGEQRLDAFMSAFIPSFIRWVKIQQRLDAFMSAFIPLK